jgi:hypothetical protein
MIVKPTHNLTNRKGLLFLTIGVQLPDGHSPTSWFRGTNVGIGGKHTLRPIIAPGDPVRRATLNEMRCLARMQIAEFHKCFPEGIIYVQRSRH